MTKVYDEGMSRIEFDEDQVYVPRDFQKTAMGEGVIIRLGLAKDKAGAQKILIGILLVLLILAVIVFAMSGSETFDSDKYPEGYLNDPDFR